MESVGRGRVTRRVYGNITEWMDTVLLLETKLVFFVSFPNE
jgi:hypothetical protein